MLIPENCTRKLDSLGRITLPKGLRDRMYLNNDVDELEIFTAQIDGRQCIVLSKPVSGTDRCREAAKILCEYGLGEEIPMLDDIAFGDFELLGDNANAK